LEKGLRVCFAWGFMNNAVNHGDTKKIYRSHERGPRRFQRKDLVRKIKGRNQPNGRLAQEGPSLLPCQSSLSKDRHGGVISSAVPETLPTAPVNVYGFN
jgi:hypothetical protein